MSGPERLGPRGFIEIEYGQAVLAVGFGGIGVLVAGSTITCAILFLVFLSRGSRREPVVTQKRIGDR